MKKVDCKYMWSSVEFEGWVRRQKNQMEKAGIRTSTAGITHKLLHDVLIPNQVSLNIPTIKMNKRRKK